MYITTLGHALLLSVMLFTTIVITMKYRLSVVRGTTIWIHYLFLYIVCAQWAFWFMYFIL